MRDIFSYYLIFTLLGLFFVACDEDPQSNITGKVTDQSINEGEKIVKGSIIKIKLS